MGPAASAVVSTIEIAAMLGLTRQGADYVTKRDGFPEPTVLGIGKVWDRDEVVAWAKATGRLPSDGS